MEEDKLFKILVFLAGLIAAGALLVKYAPNWYKWIGNLPGDFSYKTENFSFYFPLATMIVISLIINILYRFYNWLTS